jgi:hypothetical protein
MPFDDAPQADAGKVPKPKAHLAASSVLSLHVYPPIGIARVGNAEDPHQGDDYTIGPEVIGGPATLPCGAQALYISDFRMPDGRIKRQAARFRVYARLKDGTAAEVTTANGVRIRWHVAVANLKAGWYEFNQAMDLPRGLSKDARRRNESLPILPVGRQILDITPTPKTIEGNGEFGPRYAFDDGSFWFKPIYLGELRTDQDGHLLFLGGRGKSNSALPGMNPLTFANNVGWHDDVCDGPVSATVIFSDGSEIEAEPGYVAVTPPNYAPGLSGLVTMDDAVRETFQREGWIDAPRSTFFTRDIWSIFDRLTGLQWVNHGLFIIHGYGSPLNARNSGVVDNLRDRSDERQLWRERVLALFRDPERDDLGFDEPKVPEIYGDAYGESTNDSREYLSVTKTQFAHLRRWASGEFVDDWAGDAPRPPKFAGLSVTDQMSHLERASLHDCLGGPFHPGIELTWTMRLQSIWKYSYRLKLLSKTEPARQNYGDVLTPEVCIGPRGPYDGVAAGALTRFLGVPWQTDGTSCNSAADYEPSTFLSMPTFWGARVPDQVLAKANYDCAEANWVDHPIQANKHFMLRVDWLRDVRGRIYYERLVHMIEEWSQLGMVLPISDPPPDLPEGTRAEQGRSAEFAGADLKRLLVAEIEGLSDRGLPQREKTVASLKEAPPMPRRPKRSFRQGEI